MTFVANPIAAPKRTHMAMPAHLAELAIRTAPVKPMAKVAAPVVDMNAIEAGKRRAREIAAAAIKEKYEREEQRLAELRRKRMWAEARRRVKLGILGDYRYHPERVHRLMNLVAQFTKVSVAEMKGKSRFAGIIKGRFIAIWIVRRNCVEPASKQKFSLPRIGRIFGGRDHTSILSALQKVEREKELHDTAKMIERMVLDAERKLYGGVDNGC